MTIKLISRQGLPLKIKAEWTEDVYTNQDRYGNIETVDVKGWLVRINGKKYPRDNYGDDGIDWTYRWTAPNTEEGRHTAIERSLSQAGLEL
tara:strand:+ start:349 stop:621 length:273 start_codon:yes stop_codon:yes gene_type:complete